MHCRPTYNDSMICIMPLHQEESSPSCHMGPIHSLFFCILHYITIILCFTYYFINQNQHLGVYSLQKSCQLAHPPLGICKHTIQEHQELNHQSPMCSLPWCQGPQPAHQDRSCGCTPAKPHAIQVWTYHPIHQYLLQWLCTFPASSD